MSGWFERARDFFRRQEASDASVRSDEDALEDELRLLSNEARWQAEPAFGSDLARKRGELERETRALFYEMSEPARSMLQGRCQKLLEEIERPDAVQARIRELRERLATLHGGSVQPDDGATVERDAT